MEVLLLMSWFLITSAEIDSSMSHIDDFLKHKRFLLKKKHRPAYHIFAPTGWLSDPGGFIYYKHQYHIFFQYHSYDGSWGSLHWGHVVSQNLIDWFFYPPAVVPQNYYDKRGCMAGSAVIHNNYLTLFYTGSLVENNKTIQTQNMAISTDGVVFDKYLYNPIIGVGPFGNNELKNPKVWWLGDNWYMILGSVKSGNACLLLYTSTNFFDWRFNTIFGNSHGDMGDVFDNPDFFELNGVHVLMLSIQGAETVYTIGNFSYDKLQFSDFHISISSCNKLDYGHDFYAAKTTKAVDGRRLLVAWLGRWNIELQESISVLASMLTVVRELKLGPGGKLLMVPVSEMSNLRGHVMQDAWFSPGEVFSAGTKAFEMIVNSSTVIYDASIILEFAGVREYHYRVMYSADRNEVSVHRDGDVRATFWRPLDHINWRIFVDSCSVEVFCGDGEVVFSSRIGPKNSVNVLIGGKTQLHVTQYKIRNSISYSKGVDTYLRKFIYNRYH